MKLDLDALEAAARAATRGPWISTYYGPCDAWVRTADGNALVHCGANQRRPQEDAAYIAAVSPDVLLSLAARLRAAEAVIAALPVCQYLPCVEPATRAHQWDRKTGEPPDIEETACCDEHYDAGDVPDTAYASALRAWLSLRGDP